MNGVFWPGFDDDDPVILPDGERYTLGEVRADPKLQRRVAVWAFLKASMYIELSEIHDDAKGDPAISETQTLQRMAEAAVSLALSAYDRIETVEHSRRSQGGAKRAADARRAREEKWGPIARDLLSRKPDASAGQLLLKLVDKGLAEPREEKSVRRYLGHLRAEIAGQVLTT